MIAEHAVGLDIVDDDGIAVLTDLIANRGFNPQLAAFRQAEVDVVANRTANPSLGCHAGDGNETHAGDAADHIQDFRDSPDLLDGLDFSFDIDRHDDLGLSLSLECNAWEQ